MLEYCKECCCGDDKAQIVQSSVEQGFWLVLELIGRRVSKNLLCSLLPTQSERISDGRLKLIYSACGTMNMRLREQ